MSFTDGGKAPALTASQPVAVANGSSYHSKLLGHRGFYSFTGAGSAATVSDGLSKSGKAALVRGKMCAVRTRVKKIHL